MDLIIRHTRLKGAGTHDTTARIYQMRPGIDETI